MLNETEDDLSQNESSDGVCLLSPESEEIALDLRYLIYGPVLFFLIAFGIVGNLLTLLIFQKRTCSSNRKERQQQQQQQRMRVRVPKMHKYLAILSIWDLMLIIASFFLYNLPYLMYGRLQMYGPYVRIYPYAYAMACVSRTGAIWILIASAVDRYFAVCHPFAHHIYSTTKRTNLVLAGCCLLSIVYGLPRYYHIILEDCFDLNSKGWTLVALGSDLRANPVYWYAYKIAADFILVSVGPFVILFYLSLAVGMAVKKSTRRSRTIQRKLHLERGESPSSVRTRRSSAAGGDEDGGVLSRPDNDSTSIRRHEKSIRRRSYQESQNSLNLMLVTVLSKFLICHSLPAVLDVCETTMDPARFQAPFMEDLVNAANALVIVNGSVNFVLYLMCSRRFRIGVAHTLFHGLKREHSRGSVPSSQSNLRETLGAGSAAVISVSER